MAKLKHFCPELLGGSRSEENSGHSSTLVISDGVDA